MSKLKIVLDTNALLVSISRKSEYRPIFDSLLNGYFTLAITNEILSEYVEIIERKSNSTVATNIAEMLLNLQNVEKVDVYFKWNLIEADEEDNKFVDCAIAARVKFVVTNDKHFDILKRIEFPKVEIIKIQEFLEELKSSDQK